MEKRPEGEAKNPFLKTTETGLAEAGLAARMRGYAEAATAENTQKAHRDDINHYLTWCHRIGLQGLPAHSLLVCAYLTDHAGMHAVSTLSRRLYTLSALHKRVGLPSPAEDPMVQQVWSGIKKTHGTASRAQKSPARTKLIRAMAEELSPSPASRNLDLRDRALLLIGFAGGFRRSELVALDTDDITDTDEGLRIAVRSSKTDQEGEGAIVGLPYGSNPETCPVRALRAWLAVSGITGGPVFRSIDRHDRISDRRLSAQSVSLIVKRRAKAAGQDENGFAAHSLRSGFATEAFSQGVPEFTVMKHGRWKSASSMRGYIREGSLFRDNAASRLGL